jgi:hypothetical protein
MLRSRILLFTSPLLIALPRMVRAQDAGVPDSVVARMVSPALVRLLDYQVAAAAFGAKQIMVFEFPKSPHWARVATHLLRVVNGRIATKADSAVLAVGVHEIRIAGDTVVASLFEEYRQLCDDGKWMHTGTDYEARTRRVYGGGWTRLEITPGMTWDGWCMRTPNVELKLTALASVAAHKRAASYIKRGSLTQAR